jgi:hypothetical protein
VKDDFGLPEPVPDLPVLGDRRGAEARCRNETIREV